MSGLIQFNTLFCFFFLLIFSLSRSDDWPSVHCSLASRSHNNRKCPLFGHVVLRISICLYVPSLCVMYAQHSRVIFLLIFFRLFHKYSNSSFFCVCTKMNGNYFLFSFYAVRSICACSGLPAFEFNRQKESEC